MKPRKRRRTSSTGSALPPAGQALTRHGYHEARWAEYDQASEPGPVNGEREDEGENKWETSSEYQYQGSEAPLEWGDDVEEIMRTEPFTIPMSAVVHSRSQYPDLAMIAPSPVPSPLLEFSSPVFGEFTNKRNRRVLVDHFCNVLSHLIVFKEDTGNPFRQLVLPLSHSSSPVMNAIFALSSAHLEYRGVENEEKALGFHNKALQGLAQLIEQNDPLAREEVLGAIMLLVYYEVVRSPFLYIDTNTNDLSSSNEVTRTS